MEDLLKNKKVIVSQDWDDDGEINFILIVDTKDFDNAVKVLVREKESFKRSESDYEMLSDAISFGLEDAGIDYLMPDFEEL